MRVAMLWVGLVLVGCGPQMGDESGQSVAGSGLTAIRPGLASALTVPEGYVATPHGYYHKSCVHSADEGDAVTLRQLPCAYPRVILRSDNPDTANGWIEDSNFVAPKPAAKMTSDFVVPSAPKSSQGQIDYFFPGLCPADGSIILQPVLAWGANPAGGGDYYSLASWSCGPSCVHGNLVEVKSGDKISGTITGSNCTTTGSCDWDIESKDTTSGAVASLKTTNDTNVYTWLFSGVLEAYGVTACDQYPAAGSMKFSPVKFYDHSNALITPTWAKANVDSTLGCNYGIKTTKETSTLSFTPGATTDFAFVGDMSVEPGSDFGYVYDGGAVDLAEQDSFSGTFDGGSTCQYTCAEYGFTANECNAGWQCATDGCLSYIGTCP